MLTGCLEVLSSLLLESEFAPLRSFLPSGESNAGGLDQSVHRSLFLSLRALRALPFPRLPLRFQITSHLETLLQSIKYQIDLTLGKSERETTTEGGTD